VNLDGNRTEFSNEGTILGTGDQRNGTIYVNGTAEDFVIQNEATGVIDAGEGNNGAGISAQIGDVVGDAVSGDASGNTAGDGVRIFSGVSEGALPSYSGDIENEGTILSGTGSLADGIDIQGVTFRGDIQNSGTIEAFGFGAGINVQDAAFSGDITTSGRMRRFKATSLSTLVVLFLQVSPVLLLTISRSLEVISGLKKRVLLAPVVMELN